jgi:hypothetical protein
LRLPGTHSNAPPIPALEQWLESDGGVGVQLTFVREIVWPDGRREVEGTTPKALPVPAASHALPRPTDPTLLLMALAPPTKTIDSLGDRLPRCSVAEQPFCETQ